ncbi:MAG: tRNA (adenosine(37)-N6)-threonylcarbamoyltransferase complex dimerization subunit type 1 TsaB [Proteobacteria bacterium]|nr:tRNA (adenosine(37)-N6)-threonylcarbamoyltransferase complex dimerization subunit type 1 TsaB [Pseudomonadota bacterium]
MLLVLDTSFSGLSMGIFDDTNQEVESFTSATPRSSDVLHTQLHQLLERHHIPPQSLTRLAVTTGPGSFTGIRIGLAVAQALALVVPGLQPVGLPTLPALAQQLIAEHHPLTPFAVLLDAAGHTVYHQAFTPHGQPLSAAVCLSLPQALQQIGPEMPFFAPSNLLLPRSAARTFSVLQPATLAEMAQNPQFHQPLQPAYIKELAYKHA